MTSALSRKLAQKMGGNALVITKDSTVGDIYHKWKWDHLNDFNVAAGFTLDEGRIKVAANQGNTLALNWNTALITHELSVSYQATNGLTNAAGLRLGFKSLNDSAANSSYLWFDEVTRKIMYFKTFDNTTTAGAAVLPAYAAGDRLSLTVRSSPAGFTATLANVTTGQSIVRTENNGPSKNTSNPCVVAQNTAVEYLITDFRYSTSMKRGQTLVIGDSIDVGSAATTLENRYATLIGAGIVAGSGDKTRELLMRLNEIILLAPGLVVLKMATNDWDLPTWKASYLKIVNTLTVAGIPILHVTPPPMGANDKTAYVDFLKTTFPDRTVDIFTPMKAAVGTGMNAAYDSGDGVHPNNAGHTIIANTILAHDEFFEGDFIQQTTEAFAGELLPNGVLPGYFGPAFVEIASDGRIKSIREIIGYDKVSGLLTLGSVLKSTATVEGRAFRGNAHVILTAQGANDLVFSTASEATPLARMYGATGGMHFGKNGVNDPGADIFRFAGKVKAEMANVSTLPVFADNAAAAGLAVGDLYRTATGEVRVKF